jgi:hypothetical protein
MARFRAEDLVLRDNQKVRFGVENDNIAKSDLWWDLSAPHPTTNGDLKLSSTISGVDPIYPYHLTTKFYVDTVFSGSDDHNELLNIQGGTTDEYYHLTNTQHLSLTSSGGVGDASSEHHHNSIYFTENEITTISGDIVNQIITDHGGLTGLGDDDHTIYIKADGLRPFTGTVSGIDPTEPEHLTTKFYVDDAISQSIEGLDWQNSVLSQTVAYGDATATTGNRYIAPTTSGVWTAEYIYEWTGTTWSGIEPNEGFATWVEDEDIVYFYNDVYPAGSWVKLASITQHNNLAGLQGGTASEYYHMTSTMYTDLTSAGGVGNASTEHIHDDRYFTESEIITISGDIIAQRYTDEEAQDAVGNIMFGAGTVTVTYNDIANTITVSGSTSGAGIDHGTLDGLEDDDHPALVPRDGTRGFLSTVSGVYPTQSYHLTTKQYVDDVTASGGVDRHGRTAITISTSQVTVSFADLSTTDYTVNASMENDTDSPPSIYAFIISNRTSSSFVADFSGDMDSANYYLNWMIILD